MSTETKPVTQQDVDNRYNMLVKIIKSIGTEAQMRVAAHIRSLTQGQHISLGIYHVAKSVPLEAKYDEYRNLAFALGLSTKEGKPHFGAPDWSKLQGQIAAGAKQGDDVETTERLDPLADETKTPADTNDQPASTQVQTTPPAKTVARATTPVKSAADTSDSLAAAIARAVESHLHLQRETTTPAIDEQAVRFIVQEELQRSLHDEIKQANLNGAFPTERVEKLIQDAMAGAVQRIEIVSPSGETKPIDGLIHPQVPQVAAYLGADVPVWAWSPAGAGKTHMARQIAEMLNLTPYVISVDPTLTVAKLLGYRNVANGEFVQGYLYDAFKQGGLVALDEVDTGDPGVIASLNALLSNGHYMFPNNETVERHPNFRVLALANTRGTGAIAGYTARNRLDAATLDRFPIIEIKYDAGLEMALATGSGRVGELYKVGTPATEATQKAFVEWVQSVREKVGQSVLISPRASINGCKLLRAGIPLAEVVQTVVTKLCAPDTISRINDLCGQPQEVA